jgi:hypothetical protein
LKDILPERETCAIYQEKIIYRNHKVVKYQELPKERGTRKENFLWFLICHARIVILKQGNQPAGILAK